MPRRMSFDPTRPPLTPHMSRQSSSRRLHLCVLASYLLVMAVAALSPWLGDAPLGPLCRSGAGTAWATAAPADADPTGHALDCAACLPLQLTAARPPGHLAPVFDSDSWRAVPPMPFTDPYRVALPPARGPPLA